MDLFDSLPPPKEPAATNELCNKRLNKEEDGEELAPVRKKVKTAEHYESKGYIGERQGEREDMQDAHIIIDNMLLPSLSYSLSNVSFYGVFDGHSGSRASKYAAENLHKILIEKFPKDYCENSFDQNVKRYLVESFKKLDADFLTLAAKATPTWKDGSTAAVVLIVDDVLYSGNLGDSKTVLYKKDNEVSCVQLTKDHTAANFDERKRIEKSGGYVREGRVMGIVEVSRSIGDGRFKGCGLIATPHVLRCPLTDDVLFIVVACDGLWNVFTKEEAGQYILNIIEDESLIPEEQDNKTNDREYRIELACNKIAVEAVKRGCTDNVTIMFIDIKKKH